MNGFLGRMGQSIFQESNNHQDVEITLGCDSDNKINSIENNFNFKTYVDINKCRTQINYPISLHTCVRTYF